MTLKMQKPQRHAEKKYRTENPEKIHSNSFTSVRTSASSAISAFCILLLSFSSFAQTPLLEKIISVKSTNEKLGSILQRIEQEAGFTFSYNSEIINTEEIITLDAQSKSVREILQLLFKGKIQYKEKGAHIILTTAPPAAEKSAAPPPVKISGYVLDSETGGKLAYVSIYNSKTLRSISSDEYGFYSIKIDKSAFPLNLSYNKINYQDTLVSLAKNDALHLLLNVPLTPVPRETPASITTIPPVRPIVPVTADSITPTLNPATLNKHELIDENVKDTLYRKFQVSFLPFAGSNHKMSGRVVNELSFNILGGFNMGVSKFELGGLFNINRAYVRKAQIAGLFNYVHGNMDGMQAGGLFNIVLRESSGVQIGGLGNIRIGSASGHQIGGLFNLAGKGITGSQVGGLFNISGGETGGMQLGGLFNYAHRSVNGAQIGGLLNVTAHDVRGLQLAGLINRARVVKGAQVGGILNVARTVNAAQIGFINIADTVKGIPFGFLSIVRTGYISFEVSADESFYANLTFRSGVRKFYNIFTGGLRFENGSEPLWAAGYGIGSSPKVGKRWHLNFELTTQQLLNSVYQLNMHLHNRFHAGFEFIAAKRFAISAGGSLNAMVSQTNYPEFTATFSPGEPFEFLQRSYTNGLEMKMWWGAKLGLKVLLGRGV